MSEERSSTELLSHLAEEFSNRLRHGENPTIDEYVQRHPELGDDLRSLLPTLMILEQAAGQLDDAETPTFPGFDVIEEIAPGVGGMGKVFRARDVSLDRIVAIKTTRADLDTPEGRAFFEAEAKAAARLDHRHIVRILSFQPDHAPPYYVMQFVEGRSLEKTCQGRDGQFVASAMEKVARALDHAHGQGIVHRDIKPANILLDLDNEPHIADFGLAGRLDDLMNDTSAMDVTSPRGTPHFIAPELFAGEQAVGRQVDLYALGVTLYRLLTGQYPYPAESFDELRREVLRGEAAMPKELDPDIPEPLQRICLKAMEREPASRYASARILADDLRRFLDGREVYARPTRYLKDRAGKFEDHISSIDQWHRQNLVDRREADRLVAPYRRILESDSPWDELSRRFPWETVALRIGGWLVLLSSILWPAFYWQDLERTERVLALGLPCALLNLAGWMYHRRGSRVNAVVFLLTGCLLLPLLVGVVLTEYDLWRAPQTVERELFGEQVTGAPPVIDGTVDEQPEEVGFAPSNVQILASLLAFLLIAAVYLFTIRARVLAAWAATGIYLVVAAALLLLGLKEWIENELVARALLCFLPICLLFIPLALASSKSDHPSLGAVFYTFFPVPLVLILTFLARFAAEEWFGVGGDWEERGVQQWLMVNGAIYFLLALWHARSSLRIVRFWGEAFLLLVPVSLLVPCNVLFEESPAFGSLGGNPVGLYEALSIFASLLLIVLGTRMRQPLLALGGLVGLGLFVVRATDRHFGDSLAWPLSLLILGGAAMLAGGILAFVRGRTRRT